MTRLILLGAAVATGVGFWLDQPYGVVTLGLAVLYAAFDRTLEMYEKERLANLDAAKAVVAMADRLTALESVIQKYELAQTYGKLHR